MPTVVCSATVIGAWRMSAQVQHKPAVRAVHIDETYEITRTQLLRVVALHVKIVS
jgi:hypothetical protein